MLLKQIIPGFHRKLRYHHGGLARIPVFQNFKKIPAFVQIQLHQKPFEIGVTAGIGLHTEPGGLFHQQLGLAGTHVENAVAAVVGLFLVLRGQQNSINHLGGIRPEALGPLSAVVAVLLIYLPVITMLGRHMLRLGNIPGESGIGPSVGTDQLVIPVTNPDLCHCCFQESRPAIHGVGHGIVMLIVVQVELLGTFPKCRYLQGEKLPLDRGCIFGLPKDTKASCLE